ncbi:GspMb/PilO family protein [Actinoplanes sp. NPDC004185]
MTTTAHIGWSPGDFTDDQLVARIGARMMAAARRILRTGYVARVHRARPGDPVPSVELPTATVRFLVPGDLGFARTDAVAGARDDVLALAVWAFREADASSEAGADLQVQVGGTAAATGGPALDAAVALTSVVLREGAVHVGAGITAEVTAVRRALEAARMRWPLLAVDDLVAQLEAYRDRSARYRPEALAEHVGELHARRRAVTGTGGHRALRSRVLGTDEASETPLRRARLDGLGARVSAAGDERTVEIFLAHADSATVLVLRRTYETGGSGPELAGRRVAGVSIGALAGGAVVTESAARSASRAVRLGTRRLSRTEAMTSRGSWQDLPRALIADDLAALSGELDALPPRPVRARVEAELVRVIPVAEVHAVSYAPGAQRLDAVIADAAGATAVVSATHAACAPGRLDSMAAALRGELRYVAGSVRRAGGGVVIDPIGFALDGSVVVPDLAEAARGADPDDVPPLATDPIGLALDEAAALLAELAHVGLQHAPATMPGRLRAAAGRLRKAGLRRVAETVEALAGRLGPDPGDAAVAAWVDAHLRVNLAADMR